MRHAEAASRKPESTDFSRSLTPHGKEQASEMGGVLLEKGWIPDQILHSGAKRTALTAELVAGEINLPPERLIKEIKLYNTTEKKIISTIQSAQLPPETNTILVIAHNPGVTQMALTCGWQNHGGYFPPGALAVFELSITEWSDFAPDYCQLTFFSEPGINHNT